MSVSVASWWAALSAVAVINITAWFFAAGDPKRQQRLQIILSGLYVFGCAFRSFLPVYDIPRICLVDSWASSVLVGRSVATIAELGFAAQWAVYLHASELGSERAQSVAHDRAAPRDCRDLLLVRGAHHGEPGPRIRKLAVGNFRRTDRRQPP